MSREASLDGRINELKMPSFGADMENGKLVQWLVKPGDSVTQGQIVAVIETQKGAIDYEVYVTGVVDQLLVDEGVSVVVGEPIALVRGEGTTDNVVETSAPVESSEDVKVVTGVQATSYPVIHAKKPASPYARRLAMEQGIPLDDLSGSGPDGAVLAKDLPARKLLNISTRETMRAAIAAALGRSKREIPHYYLESTMDVQVAADWVTEFNHGKPADQQLLINALLHCAVAKALRKSKEFNGYFVDGQFSAAEDIHLGTGISIRGGGVISPAILYADRLGPVEMMSKLKDLSERVRNGGLRSSEMSSATVTLSSMGERGSEKLFGIIYPPQVALIGIGKPSLRPWVVGDEIKVRMLVSVSLAADHRVSDGRQGARLLSQISKLLRKPETL